MRVQRKILFLSLFLPLFAGFISTLIIKDDIAIFHTLQLPPLTSPSWIFPMIWFILYLFMGIGFYLIALSNHFDKPKVLSIYFIQLVVQFLWFLVFFHFQYYRFSFLILLALIAFVILMIQLFYKISSLASLLQIPYLIWILFLIYFNLGILILN